MKRKSLPTIILCLGGLMSLSAYAFQIEQLGDLFGAAKEKSIKNLITSEPITTSIRDTNTASVLPDDYGNNIRPKNLASMPRNPQGGYILSPGFYEMVARSYCLHAGTHAPGKGDGYLFAPLKGKREEIVKTILRNSEQHLEIQRSDIQVLIWAILAKTKYSNLSAKIKSTAQVLLSQKQISDLNGGVLGYVPEPLMRKITASLPKELQKIVEIENQMRSLFDKGSSNYTEFERLAVLPGEAFVNRPDIKRGRWSKHPDGYYVRYYPNGFSQTKVQVYVPESGGSGRNGILRNSFLASSQTLRSIIFDAFDDVAVPANTGAQRLAQSNVPVDGIPKPISASKAPQGRARNPEHPTIPITSPVPCLSQLSRGSDLYEQARQRFGLDPSHGRTLYARDVETEISSHPDAQAHIEETLEIFRRELNWGNGRVDLPFILTITRRESGADTISARGNRRVVTGGKYDTHPQGEGGLDNVYDHRNGATFPRTIRDSMTEVPQSELLPTGVGRHPARLPEKYFLGAFISELEFDWQRVQARIREEFEGEVDSNGRPMAEVLLNEISVDARRVWIATYFGNPAQFVRQIQSLRNRHRNHERVSLEWAVRNGRERARRAAANAWMLEQIMNSNCSH